MIPAVIQALLPQQLGEEDRIGLSGAQVVMYEDCVLKVQPDTGNAANEGIMLRFLKGRLPVPEVLAEAVQGGMRYLLPLLVCVGRRPAKGGSRHRRWARYH